MLVTDEQIISRIIDREGRNYTDDPTDRGGATKFGITQKTLSDWLRRPATKDDVRRLTESAAKAIYRALYLNPFIAVDPIAREQVVDMAVHHGVSRAKGLLAKAQMDTSRPLAAALTVQRLLFYAAIMEKDHSQAKYAKGWIARAVSFI